MPTFDIETEEITAFDTGDRYIFKSYFDEDQLFQQLEKYYNSDKYRFETPHEDIEEVRQLLDEYFYELKTTDRLEDYSVVVPAEADSSDILRNSVMQKHRRQNEILVMKDKLSVKQAEEKGAVPLEESPVQNEELEWKPA
jgi:hypothetical protein